MNTHTWRAPARAILTERGAWRTAVVALVFGLSALTGARRVPHVVADVEKLLHGWHVLALIEAAMFEGVAAGLIRCVWWKKRPYESAGSDAATACFAGGLLCLSPFFFALFQPWAERLDVAAVKLGVPPGFAAVWRNLVEALGILPVPLGSASILLGAVAAAIAGTLAVRRARRAKREDAARALAREPALVGTLSPAARGMASRMAAAREQERRAGGQKEGGGR